MSPRLQKWADRLDWFEGLWTTQCSFAVGALAVFVPLWPALMAQHSRLKELETAHRTRVQFQQMDTIDELGGGRPVPIPHRLPE